MLRIYHRTKILNDNHPTACKMIIKFSKSCKDILSYALNHWLDHVDDSGAISLLPLTTFKQKLWCIIWKNTKTWHCEMWTLIKVEGKRMLEKAINVKRMKWYHCQNIRTLFYTSKSEKHYISLQSFHHEITVS